MALRCAIVGNRLLQPLISSNFNSKCGIVMKNAGKTDTPQLIKVRYIQTGTSLQAKSMNYGFTVKDIRKNYSLIPLISAVGFACVVVVGFSGYFWYTRPDITMFRYAGAKKLEETMDLKNPPHLKFYKCYDGDRALPELADLYKEMEEAAAELAKK